jgi:hypothetical protein
MIRRNPFKWKLVLAVILLGETLVYATSVDSKEDECVSVDGSLSVSVTSCDGPISADIRIRLGASGRKAYIIGESVFGPSDPPVLVVDVATGMPATARALAIKPAGQVMTSLVDSDGSGMVAYSVPLHLWYEKFASGKKYRAILHRLLVSTERNEHPCEFDLAEPVLLGEFEISEEIDSELEYQRLLEHTLGLLKEPYGILMGKPGDFALPRPVKELLWGIGPAAATSQLTLLDTTGLNQFSNSALVHTYDNIARFASAEQLLKSVSETTQVQGDEATDAVRELCPPVLMVWCVGRAVERTPEAPEYAPLRTMLESCGPPVNLEPLAYNEHAF